MTMLTIIAEVARDAIAHQQSVERRLLGLPVRGRVGQRIDEQLAVRGLKPGAGIPMPSASSPPPAQVG